MIDGYAKGGEVGTARELFYRMRDKDRNLVTWNTMIGGYALLGDDGIDVGRELFDRMARRDSISWNLMIDGYAKCRRMDEAVDLINRLPHKDVISWANLIAGYMEVGNISEASKLFEEMPDKDVIKWNIMMAGYVKNGRFVEALHLFNKMLVGGSNVVPDNTTIAITLAAISELGRLEDGVSIHDYIKRNRLPLNEKVGVGLIDMYSKCGRLDEALHVFEISSGRNIDHWNAMIGGLAIHGHGKLALELFHEMEKRSIKPDDITFIGIGMWRDARSVRMIMKKRELMKIPGCSCIELDGLMHKFVVGDNFHPRAKEAYSLLEELCAFKLYSSHVLCSIQHRSK